MGLRTTAAPRPAQVGLQFPATQQRREQLATGAAQMTAPLQAAQAGGTQGLAGLDARGLAAAGAQAGVAQEQAVAQAVQQGAQQQTQAAEDVLSDERAKKEGDLRTLKTLVSRQARELSGLLYKEDASAQGELFDGSMRFEQDELGRTVLNDRQLADYAVTSAKSQEELADYEQEVNQALERKQALLQQAFSILSQTEAQVFEREQTEANQDLQRRIAEAKQKLEADMAKLQNEAANSAAIWGAVTAAGAALTLVFPPAGLAVTAVGAAGGAYSAQQSKERASARQGQGVTI